MPYCDQCQIIHGEEHRFCQRCGQLLKSARAASGRGCARCGSPTFPGQKFCTECGLPLRVARVSQQEEEYEAERPPLFYPRRTEPMPRRRSRRPSRILSMLGVFALVVVVWVVWSKLPARAPINRGPANVVTAPQDDVKREVEQISERIRAAHLNKDINKWLACYSSSYPNLGHLENRMLEMWKNYDIKEVNYRISNVQRLSDTQVAADIVWNIQIYDQRTHDYTLIRTAYKTILEKGPGGWKIKDSKEEGGGAA
ncbi:MAG: zinc ribbon domain-containing protein [Deltaproteobacteria bacterium]|nr:zinc ribbon domain-containing protein [Deltaproteobacteria bacterium]